MAFDVRDIDDVGPVDAQKVTGRQTCFILSKCFGYQQFFLIGKVEPCIIAHGFAADDLPGREKISPVTGVEPKNISLPVTCFRVSMSAW